MISNKMYDVLKWVTMICIPALTTAYVGLSAVWGWPYATEVAKTSAVICTLLGALLGISTAQSNKENQRGYGIIYRTIRDGQAILILLLVARWLIPAVGRQLLLMWSVCFLRRSVIICLLPDMQLRMGKALTGQALFQRANISVTPAFR